MPDQLSIYNGALRMIGERRLADLSEDVESRYVLDDIWDDNGIKRCLEKGFWLHAMRAVELDYDPDFTTPFGHKYTFEFPSDFVKLYSLCTDEFFTHSVALYQTEGNFIFCDYTKLYMRYVSDDASYGMDMSLWPETFTEYVEGYFALRAIKVLTDAQTDEQELKDDVKKLLTKAKSESALREPTGLVEPSGWAIARSRLDYGRRRQHPYR